MRPINPFYTTNIIPAPFFCDRERETNNLALEIASGNNVLLMSPRRMGKTGLINHLFEDSRIKKTYNTFFIDIYDTSTLRELTFRLGKEVYDKMSLWDKARGIGFLGVLQSLKGEFSVDPVSMSPRFALSVGQINNPEATLDEILEYLNKQDKPCIVAIDEFQQISDYEDNRVEAVLRTKIQRLNNIRFIFCGSERHLLNQMFLTKSRPFYRSTSSVVLDRIKKQKYIDFAKYLFKSYGKDISDEAVSTIYDMVDGYTYYLQRTMSYTFSRTAETETQNVPGCMALLEQLIQTESSNFKSVLSLLSASQREVLYAIAMAGKAVNILSKSFVSKYHLGVPSSVQSAVRSLLKKQLISRSGDVYSIEDKFLELYLKMDSGLSLQQYSHLFF